MRDKEKEILSFTGNGEKLFEVKLIKFRSQHNIIVTDESKGIKKKKVYNTTSQDKATAYFHKVVKLFTDRI